ncbi:MAG: oligopeptide:H+ symporter, partial [Bacteroidota bacterium]
MDSSSPMGANSNQIFGHKPGLFVLFFTEMWERFSYYGMRVLLVVFLVEVAFDEQWSRADALALYGIYTGFVYFTPMIGGILADRYLGYRRAVALGALVMTLGHASMALETEVFFYLGLLLLIIGNGLFKPNISSIVGQLYSKNPELKDGAYTIFYMGINAGAFLGIGLCSYYGEQISYSLGFGLAGIFMLVGLLQFWFSQDIFGRIGLPPSHPDYLDPSSEAETGEDTDNAQLGEQILDDQMAKAERTPNMPTPSSSGGGRIGMWAGIGLVIAIGVYFLVSWFFGPQDNSLQTFSRLLMPPIVLGSVVAFVGWIVSDPSLNRVERDRVWVIIVLSFFIIFFWWAFEQAG